MQADKVFKPEIMVFAGPNGSGKSTITPFRIFKKRKSVYFRWENDFWDYDRIAKLTGISDYDHT